MSTQTTAEIASAPVNVRHAHLADRRVATAPSDDDAVEAHGLGPFERITRQPRVRRSHTCVSSPAHVIAVTGRWWCRTRRRAVNITVDALTADVGSTPPRGGSTPHDPATRRIGRCRRVSIATAGVRESFQDGRR
jgi:hypothetical protein